MSGIAPTTAVLPTAVALAATPVAAPDTDLSGAWTAVSNNAGVNGDVDIDSVWNAAGAVTGGGATPVANAQAGADSLWTGVTTAATGGSLDTDVDTLWNVPQAVTGGGGSDTDPASSWVTPVPGVASSDDDVADAWSDGISASVQGGAGAPAPAAAAAPTTGTSGSTANAELKPLLDVLARTQTGSQVVDALRRSNITINLVPTSVFRQTHSADTLAVFDSGSNTITLQRDQVIANPVRTALTFAHEATHALDDGRIDSSVSAAEAAARMTSNPQESFAQGQFEVHMTAEARAYRNEAETAIELGMDPRTSIGLTPAVDPATGGVRNFAATWQAVATLAAYNPSGRTGTPRDFT